MSAVPKIRIGVAAAARIQATNLKKRPGSAWLEPAQLTTRLTCARSVPEVLETGRRFREELEIGHLPVAWSRISRLGRSGPERDWLRSNLVLLSPFADHSKELMESDLLEPKPLAQLAQAIATAGLRSDEPGFGPLWGAIEFRGMEVLEDSELTQYATIAWAMVEARHDAGPYLNAAGVKLRAELKVEASTSKGAREARMVRGIAENAPVPVEDLALFAAALARGDVTTATPKATATATQKVNASNAGQHLMAAIAVSAEGKLDGLRPSHMIKLLNAFVPKPASGDSASYRLPALERARARLLSAIACELLRRTHELKPAEVADVAWAYGEAAVAEEAKGAAATEGAERAAGATVAAARAAAKEVTATEAGATEAAGGAVAEEAEAVEKASHLS